MVLPSQMREVLHAPYPKHIRTSLWWADFESLRTLYRDSSDDPKVHEAQLAMENAIANWSDEQVTDFLLNHCLEPPTSTELRSRSPAELRRVLDDIYRYLFDLSKPHG